MVIRYHLRAGMKIRSALLSRVRQLVATETMVSHDLKLTLPAVDAGELAVLRVADVIHTVVHVPYGQINCMVPVES